MAGWWGKEAVRGTPVVVKMENPNNWSMVEIESPDFMYPNDAVPKGGRNKNAKQLTWVILLKAHKAAGCLASIAAAFVSLAALVRRRIASGRTDRASSRFYTTIKAVLCFSLLLLAFELAAYFKGWHLGAPDLHCWELAQISWNRVAAGREVWSKEKFADRELRGATVLASETFTVREETITGIVADRELRMPTVHVWRTCRGPRSCMHGKHRGPRHVCGF